MAVASSPLSLSSCCAVTSQEDASVAAVTASANVVAEDEAMIAVTSVVGSAGTVIGAGSKYWHARFAGVVTVDQLAE